MTKRVLCRSVATALCAATLLIACGGSDAAAGCEDFRDLVDEVQADDIAATSDEVVDRLEEIGQTLQESDDQDLADAGLYAASTAQAARSFPEDRDRELAPVIDRLDEACS